MCLDTLLGRQDLRSQQAPCVEDDEALAVAMAFAATPARPASRAVADRVAREVRNRHHRDSYDFREGAARAVLKHLAGGADEEIPYWAYDHTGRYSARIWTTPTVVAASDLRLIHERRRVPNRRQLH